MGPGAVLDLREIGLAEAAAEFLFESQREVALRHLAAEFAERTFDQAQVAEFFSELHCNSGAAFDAQHPYYDLQLSYCNL